MLFVVLVLLGMNLTRKGIPICKCCHSGSMLIITTRGKVYTTTYHINVIPTAGVPDLYAHPGTKQMQSCLVYTHYEA